jgi:hypothetical protein
LNHTLIGYKLTLKQNLELYRLLRSEFSSKDFSIFDVAALINQKLADVFQIDVELTYADNNGPYPNTTSFNASTNSDENKAIRSKLTGRIKPIRSFLTSLKNNGYLRTKTVPGGQTSYRFVDKTEAVDAREFLPLFLLNSLSTQLIPAETNFKTWFSDKTIEFEQDQFEITSEDLFSKVAQRFTLPLYGPFHLFESENELVFNQLIHAFYTKKCQKCITEFTSFEAYPIHFSVEFNGLFVYFKLADASILKIAFYDIKHCVEITNSAVLPFIPFEDLSIQHPLSGVQVLDMNSEIEPVSIKVSAELYQVWAALGLKSFADLDFNQSVDDSTVEFFFYLDENDLRFAKFIAKHIDGIRSISSEILKNNIKEVIMNSLSRL